jgi:3-deoxy-manno-octulosonate cytidylyltransferase (CMP-KDO synthetase)
MIERVWRGARRCRRLREVVVATDDPRIVALCEGFGAAVCLTSPDHPSGTDRVAEAVATHFAGEDVVVNIQGDEPLIEPFVIDAALDALAADPEVGMATVAHAMDEAERDDPNRVKVVTDRRGRALYFSRARIPWSDSPAALHSDRPVAPRSDLPAALHKEWWQHVGLYAYRAGFLERFVALPRGDLEQAEGLEQLRALEHGHPIAVGRIEGWRSHPVDVPADVAGVERVLAGSGRRER